jgi:hypothetical protein
MIDSAYREISNRERSHFQRLCSHQHYANDDSE